MRAKLAGKSGIRITGMRDASNGPLCGDCTGRLLEGRHPIDGYRCPICRRVWSSHLEPRREAMPLEQCGRCAGLYRKEEGHLCPRLPTPRRREAVMATRENNGT